MAEVIFFISAYAMNAHTHSHTHASTNMRGLLGSFSAFHRYTLSTNNQYS